METMTAEQLAAELSAVLKTQGLQLVASDELAALREARAELAALRAELDEERRADRVQTMHGCGDNLCMIARPTGMATNGGCRCGRAALKSALWRAREERDAARTDGARERFGIEREACLSVLRDHIQALTDAIESAAWNGRLCLGEEAAREALRGAIRAIQARSAK